MKRTIKIIILLFVFFIGAGTYAVNAQNPPAHAKAHGVKKKIPILSRGQCLF